MNLSLRVEVFEFSLTECIVQMNIFLVELFFVVLFFSSMTVFG